MLIDEEPNTPSELEVEETKTPDLPEKYRTKSLEEVIRMHQEAEKLIGKQAQEVGEVRKLADELLKQSLSSKQQPSQIEDEPEVDFFENPQKAVQKTVDKHPMCWRHDKLLPTLDGCRLSKSSRKSTPTTLSWFKTLSLQPG